VRPLPSIERLPRPVEIELQPRLRAIAQRHRPQLRLMAVHVIDADPKFGRETASVDERERFLKSSRRGSKPRHQPIGESISQRVEQLLAEREVGQARTLPAPIQLTHSFFDNRCTASSAAAQLPKAAVTTLADGQSPVARRW
jgi:hypothetical protein